MHFGRPNYDPKEKPCLEYQTVLPPSLNTKFWPKYLKHEAPAFQTDRIIRYRLWEQAATLILCFCNILTEEIEQSHSLVPTGYMYAIYSQLFQAWSVFQNELGCYFSCTNIKPHKSLETNPVSWILVLTFGLSSICMLIDHHQGHSRRLELIGGIRSEFLVGFQLHANHIGASRIFLSSHLFEWTAHIVSFFATCESEKLLLFLSCIWKHKTCNFQQLTHSCETLLRDFFVKKLQVAGS